MLRTISNFSKRAITQRSNSIRQQSSASILNKLHGQPKMGFKFESKTSAFHTGSFRSYSSIIEKMIQERYQHEEQLKTEVDQLLSFFQLKKNPLIHGEYAALMRGNPCLYYSNLKKLLLELNKINQLNQKSFDKLYSDNIQSAADSLELLNEMELYNKENIEFLFSFYDFSPLTTILKSFKNRHELFNEDYSFDTLNKKLEYIKKHENVIAGIAHFSRAALNWSDIVKLVETNENKIFNDKAFISHLIFKYNKTLNMSIDSNRQILLETLQILDKNKEVLPAIVKELKSNSEKYQSLKNDLIPILINLAKKSQLPSQWEILNSKERSCKR